MQQQKTISHAYFKELEGSHQLLIQIKDNGTPLLLTSELEPHEVQTELFNQAEKLATDTYDFNFHPLYLNSIERPTVTFQFRGFNGKDYLVAITLFKTEQDFAQITLLKDLTDSNHYVTYIKLLFAALVLGGTVLLVLFSFSFVGMAIKPIAENQKKQAEFIAAASHELRAPLTVIEAGMFSLNCENDPHSTHFIELMQNECTRMKRLISDLLTLARSDAHTWQMQFAEFEIDSLLIDLYDGFHTLSLEKGIKLSLDLPDDLLPPILGDADRIKQALTILLDNALSYVPSGQSITLCTELTPKALHLKVIDTGIGISDEDKAHIFERFYQGDRSRHEKNHYGLGLSIAYEIATLHHGQLLLTDTPGGGCTFTISLPYTRTPSSC